VRVGVGVCVGVGAGGVCVGACVPPMARAHTHVDVGVEDRRRALRTACAGRLQLRRPADRRGDAAGR